VATATVAKTYQWSPTEVPSRSEVDRADSPIWQSFSRAECACPWKSLRRPDRTEQPPRRSCPQRSGTEERRPSQPPAGGQNFPNRVVLYHLTYGPKRALRPLWFVLSPGNCGEVPFISSKEQSRGYTQVRAVLIVLFVCSVIAIVLAPSGSTYGLWPPLLVAATSGPSVGSRSTCPLAVLQDWSRYLSAPLCPPFAYLEPTSRSSQVCWRPV
jgi:hypothetical protein